MTLTRRVTQGLALITGSEAARQVTHFLFGITLARILSPRDYGLLAMAMFLIGFLEVVAAFGGTQALIQRREVTPSDWSAVFWLGVGLAAVAAGLAWVFAPVAASYFQDDAVTPIIRATVWVVLLRTVGATQAAWFSRQLRFRAVALFEWVGVLIAGMVGLSMAWAGWGVWSLVGYTLAGPGTTSLLLLVTCPWRPSLGFSLASVQSVLKFGVSLQAQNVLNFLNRHLDDAIIGRFAGPADLGHYSRAYHLMLYPVQNIAGVVGRVMFPALAEIGSDLPRLRSAYLRAVSGIAMVSFPLMLGLLVTAPEAVVVLYGHQWRPAVPILQVLCVVGLMQSIATTVGWIYMARGATGVMLSWTAVATPVICGSFLVGIRWGAIGVATAYALATGVLLLPCFIVPLRLIHLPLSTLLSALRAPLIGSTIMLVTVSTVRSAVLAAGRTQHLVLALSVIAGGLSYVAWLVLVRPQAATDVWRAWIDFRRPHSQRSSVA